MIQGSLKWNDRNTFHVQTNNAIEDLVPGLEYCGPTASVMCIDSLRKEFQNKNSYGGSWVPQDEDFLTCFFIDHANWNMFEKIRQLDLTNLPPNRIFQYYPYAVKMCFNQVAEYREDGSFDIISQHLWNGEPCQICLKDPGHFLAAVAFDNEKNEIIYNDPWPGRNLDGNGFNRRMGKSDFNLDVMFTYILYRK
jgi:hypothetical protein